MTDVVKPGRVFESNVLTEKPSHRHQTWTVSRQQPMQRQKGSTARLGGVELGMRTHTRIAHTHTFINRYSVKTAGTVTFGGVIQNQEKTKCISCLDAGKRLLS